MDAEMAQKIKWMNAMGGMGNTVSDVETTQQLYNNAGEHRLAPITTKRTRDVTPQERIAYMDSLFGRR